MTEHRITGFWRSKSGIVCAGFLAIAAFFLLTEHTAHVLGALPWLLLAACPLMHLFMHHGGGTHRHGSYSNTGREDQSGSAGERP